MAARAADKLDDEQPIAGAADAAGRSGGAGVEDVEPPPEAVIVRTAAAFAVSRALHVAAQLGIADLVSDCPRTVEHLARETKTDPPSLHRVLRLLATSGFFSEVSEGLFGQTRLSETLRSSHASAMRARVLGLGSQVFWDAFGRLQDTVATGRTGVQLAFGVSLWDYFDRHPEEGSLFNRFMAARHVGEHEAVAAAYDWSSASRVMDVGGGTGSLMTAVLSANPHLSGIILDRREVVEEARAAVAGRGLAGRCEVLEGDFLQGVRPAEADVTVLCHVIHDWDDDSAVTILRNARAAMRPGDRLLVVESLLPAGDVSHPVKLLDVFMLAGPGGRERTEEEYRDLLRRAGLRLNRVLPTSHTLFDVALIEALSDGPS
jgi:ubiquinone/menaquinone biosynthesis C-methylase UbiE